VRCAWSVCQQRQLAKVRPFVQLIQSHLDKATSFRGATKRLNVIYKCDLIEVKSKRKVV
jgi:hypothetical protein